MLKPKALLFSHICYAEHITGAEKMLLFVARELRPYFHCTLVVPNEGVLSALARSHGIEVAVHFHPNLYELYQPARHMEEILSGLLRTPEFASLMDLLQIQAPDLVIANTCVNALPAAAARKIGIPVAWIIAETMNDNPYRDLAAQIIHRYADWLIGISHAALQPFANDIYESKKMVIPPSWRPEELAESAWPAERLQTRMKLGIAQTSTVVGYISADIYAQKGLEHFIRMALPLCPSYPQAHFLIAGEPADLEYFDSCLRLIEASGHAGRFSIVPFDSHIDALYSAMDIVVVPSLLEEGFGLTALEGLMFGKAVVAYRAGGLAEILTATGNGHWLADKHDIAALSEHVGRLLSDPTLLAGVGQRNEAAVRQVYGIEAYRQRLRYFLSRVLPELEHREQLRHAAEKPFPEGSLVKGAESHAVYAIEGGCKRPFESAEAFRFYKLRWSGVTPVSEPLLRLYPTAASIRAARPFAVHAPGRFLAKGDGPTLYLIQHGHRHPFASEAALFARGLRFDEAVSLPEEELVLYAPGEPLIGGDAPAVTVRKRPRAALRKRLGARKRPRKLQRKPAPRRAARTAKKRSLALQVKKKRAPRHGRRFVRGRGRTHTSKGGKR